jgi:threonine synthase
MGLPVRRLRLATNENDILSRFFASGVYSLGKVVPTLSPSMDIQIASNFERWLFLHAGRDAAQVRAWMDAFAKSGSLEVPRLADGSLDATLCAGRADTAATLETIRRFHADFGYLMDPHTAVGVSVALASGDAAGCAPVVCLSTAHPAKFPDAIGRATGDASLATEPRVEALKGAPTRKFPLPNDLRAVADFVAART